MRGVPQGTGWEVTLIRWLKRRVVATFVPMLAACSQPVTPPGSIDDADADLVVVLPYMDPEITEEQMLDAHPGVLDVHFSVDTTASFEGEIRALRESLSTRLVPELQARVADVAFGVSGFEDFPVAPFGSPRDNPFTLLMPMTTNSEEAQMGVESLMLGNGSDLPESGYEALYQIATGDGFPMYIDAYEGVGEGGVGFRPGSFRVVVHITDAESHTPASYGSAVPATHSEAEVIDAMRALGISVVGVASDSSPIPELQRLALATGATTDPIDGQCPTGLSGANVPPVDGTCPLVFTIGANGAGLSDAIEDGIVGLLDTLVFHEVYGQTLDDEHAFVQGIDATSFRAPRDADPTLDDLRPADGVADTFSNVARGTEVGFSLRFRNTTIPPERFTQTFPLTIEIVGDDSVLRRVAVQVVVPSTEGLPEGVSGGGTFSQGACSASGTPASEFSVLVLLAWVWRRR